MTMSAKSESTYWLRQKQWYTSTPDGKKFVLKPNAPKRVKESFLLWAKGFPDLVVMPE